MKELHLRSPIKARKIEPSGVAWYDVKGKGWLRDFFVLLHPPYTLWHLSYVPMGAALAPVINWTLLGWTVLAFFLGMGIAGHCLDELNGRPLRTTLPTWLLIALAAAGVFGAVWMGTTVALDTDNIWLLPCMLFGGFIVLAYNQEWPTEHMKVFILSSLPTGFFHRDEWFGIAWGAFPAMTAYIAQTHTVSWPLLLVAFYAWASSMAQRKLSLQSRFWRRKVSYFVGNYWLENAGMGEYAKSIDKQAIIGPADLALKYLNVAVVAVAVGLLLMRV